MTRVAAIEQLLKIADHLEDSGDIAGADALTVAAENLLASHKPEDATEDAPEDTPADS